MDDRDLFMTQIAADPQDDDLRRDFARWLSERGDPRGEFISTQYEIEAALEEGGRTRDRDGLARVNERLDALKRRSDELLAAHGGRWLGPLGDLVLDVGWRKGFPTRLVVDAEVFRDNAQRIVRLAPTADSLELVCNKPGAADQVTASGVLNSPAMDRVEHLYLRGPWGDGAARQIATSHHLKYLKTLFIVDAGVGAQGAVGLLGSGELPGLEELYLSGNGIGPEGALLLLGLKGLPPSLAVLALDDAGINDGAAALLSQNDALRSLRELSLRDNPLSIQGIEELIKSRELKDLVLHVDTDVLPRQARRSADEQLAARHARQRLR